MSLMDNDVPAIVRARKDYEECGNLRKRHRNDISSRLEPYNFTKDELDAILALADSFLAARETAQLGTVKNAIRQAFAVVAAEEVVVTPPTTEALPL